jgi:predicted transposase/invertase (TIGR01784 family)
MAGSKPYGNLSFDESWENLTLSNDFVFCKAMLNEDLCKDVLEAILGVSIERIEYVGRQETLDAIPEGKGVRLDVYVRDDAGSVYNVEMQTTDTHELPKRARYYHSLMDLDQIERGDPYYALGSAIVIFICTFDPFGCNSRVYWFESTCRKPDGLLLGDGIQTIFLCSSATEGGDGGLIDELLDYVDAGTVTGELSGRLDAEVASVLDSKKWRLEYMNLQVRDMLNYDRGVEHGQAIGQAEGEKRLASLMAALLRDGRNDEALRATSDEELRKRLYAEYGIEKA